MSKGVSDFAFRVEDETFIDRVVGQVLAERKQLSADVRKDLECMLRKFAAIDGFRDPWKAPQCQRVVADRIRQEGFFDARLTAAWLELNGEVVAKVMSFLANSAATGQSAANAEPTNPDALHELSASFLSENQGLCSSEEACLALSYGLARGFASNCECREASLAGTYWEEVLSRLSTLGPEAPEWGVFDVFLNAVEKLRSECSVRELWLGLQTAFESLRDEFGDLFSYLGLQPPTVPVGPEPPGEDVISLPEKLRATLEQGNELRRQKGKSWERDQELDEQISGVYEQIRSLLELVSLPERDADETSLECGPGPDSSVSGASAPEEPDAAEQPPDDAVDELGAVDGEANPNKEHGIQAAVGTVPSGTGGDTDAQPLAPLTPTGSEVLEDQEEHQDEDQEEHQDEDHQDEEQDERNQQCSNGDAHSDHPGKAPSVCAPEGASGAGAPTARNSECPPLISALVSDIRQSAEPHRTRQAQDLAWYLLGQGNTHAAYALLKLVGRLEGVDEPHLTSGLAATLILAERISFSDYSTSERYREELCDLEDRFGTVAEWQTDVDRAVILLALAATLRPALVAPETGAANLLQSLRIDQPALRSIREAVLLPFNNSILLTPGLLRSAASKVTREEQIEDLQSQVRSWRRIHVQKRLSYAPATELLRNWVKDRGFIGSVLSVVENGGHGSLEKVEELRNELADRRIVLEHIRTTDGTLRRHAAGVKPIEGQALEDLFAVAKECRDLLVRWTELTAPEKDAGFLQQIAHDLLEQCEDRLPAAVDYAASLAMGETDLRLRASGLILRQALESLDGLRDDARTTQSDRLGPDCRLNQALLLIPDLALDDHFDVPAHLRDEALQGLLDLAATASLGDRASAVQHHLATGRMRQAKALLDMLEDESYLQVDALKDDFERKMIEYRANFAADVRALQSEIESAVKSGLTETERLALQSELQAVNIDSVVDFPDLRQTLDKIKKTLDSDKQGRLDGLRERLAEARSSKGTPLTRPVLDLVEKLIRGGEAHTAEEYLDLVERGDPVDISEVAEKSELGSFFPGYCDEMIAWLRQNRNKKDLIALLRQGGQVGPLSTSSLPRPRQSESAAFMEAWFQLENLGSSSEAAKSARYLDHMKVVLGFCGFDLATETWAPGNRGQNLDCLTHDCRFSFPISRETSIIPHYGSLSQGWYRVVSVWGRPSPESIVEAIRAASTDYPVLVFYFGPLSRTDRLKLATLARQRNSMFLTVDTVMALFLCGVRDQRMPVLFRCALPFSVASPYSSQQSGFVPPEMFFGRRRARETLLDTRGAVVVFGGRQLGKTALLRDIERNPGTGVVTGFVTLSVAGIGGDNASDMWAEMAKAFRFPPVTDAAGFARKAKSWLEKHKGQRLLALLDEADMFLEGDREQVPGSSPRQPNVEALRDLMQDTGGRFKAVLAGLHSVQRFADDPNTVFGQFGQPVCIGPLYEDGEWKDALDLVVRPLEALGYRFESTDLPMRILAHTNYYPSLIQIFCERLLQRLNSRDGGSPPYLISGTDIDTVLTDESVQKNIVIRFNLTLALDIRYKVIALIIALECSLDKATLTRGLAVADIREDAVKWHPAAFREDRTELDFRVLLDEMQGLGILRAVRGNAYALRNANILALLGTRDEIENQLLTASDQAPPKPLQASWYRRALSIDTRVRSPLTKQQETVLSRPSPRVAVVFGCQAAGIARTVEALRGVFSAPDVSVQTELDSPPRIAALLKERIHQRDLRPLVVEPTCPWDIGWACEVARTAGDRGAKTIFLGGEQHAAAWVGTEASLEEERNRLGIDVVSLKRWNDDALRCWIDDTGVVPVPDDRARQLLLECSGGWPEVIQLLVAQKASDLNWDEFLVMWPDDETLQTRLRPLFDIPPEFLSVCAPMTELSDDFLSADELHGFCEACPPERVSRFLKWCELLGFVDVSVDDDADRSGPIRARYRLEGVVRRVVSAMGTA